MNRILSYYKKDTKKDDIIKRVGSTKAGYLEGLDA